MITFSSMSHKLSFLLLFFTLHYSLSAAAQALPRSGELEGAIDLSGEWNIKYKGNKGNVETTIHLPGSMLTNGLGDKVTIDTKWVGSLYDSSYFHNPAMEKYRREENIKFPFFLTPKTHYVGNAVYSRKVFVPKEWKKKRVILHLERPHIEASVYVNDKFIGKDSTLSVPHYFDVTDAVIFGKENSLRINIYNGIENVCVGQDSHSVTDQTQGDWNGIAGKLELISRPQQFIDEMQIFPNVKEKNIRVELTLANARKALRKKAECTIRFKGMKISEASQSIAFDKTGKATLTLDVPNAQLWDEFTPNIYELTFTIDGETVTEHFGMREISTNGREMILNGHPIYIRGTVGNCCFPDTGFPPTDEKSWLRIFQKCKEYGLNMMRFHSYCPPEAAFTAADKVGFYLQPEGPSWPNHGVKLGNGMTIDKYLLQETERMVKEYGNHPSFCMLAAGNEPAGNWVKWVGDFCDHWRATGDNRRIYCGASVGGGWAFDPKSDYHVKGGARGLDWDRHAPQATDDYSAAVTEFVQKGRTTTTFKINEPYLSHEQGQWCAFPDFKEISQYKGVYKAGNFEIFRDILADNGMASQAEKFLHASGKLQTLAYKYEMERNLRTPNYTGFQLLSLNDYSGQGTALVGVLNVYWREKGYCTAKDWTQFCAPVVPLVHMPRFVFEGGDAFRADVSVYNATAKELKDKSLVCMLKKGNGESAGVLKVAENMDFAIGKNLNIGKLEFNIPEVTEPTKFTLEINFDNWDSYLNHAPGMNSYDFWVYPSLSANPDGSTLPRSGELEGAYISDTLDTKALSVLKKGGKVLLTAAGKVTMGDDVKQTYLPVFWNTSWFKMRPPHTTGATIDTSHPLFRNFPTDDWANLNWHELLNRAQVINLQDFPTDYQPCIQPIDTWHVSRKLGMLAEVNIEGGGKLLITTMDIQNNLDSRPVARQMRKAILEYINSNEFNPQFTVNIQTISDLYTKRAKPVNMFTNESPDELKPKLK